MIKKHLPSIIAFVLILAAIFYYYFSYPSRPEIGPDEAALTINFGETKRAFTGETIENMTFLDALLASAKAGNFSFDFDKNILKTIDQIEEGEKKWNAYSNKEKIDDYLDDVLIEPGDKLELKLE